MEDPDRLQCCGCEPPQMSKILGRVRGAPAEARNSTEDCSPRPAGAPPKSKKEAERHEKEFKKMLEQFAKKEQAKAESDRRHEEQQLARKKQRDKAMGEATRTWCESILPHWEHRSGTAATRKLWAKGLPPKVRGTVWELALGNEVGINPEVWGAILEQIGQVIDGDGSGCSPAVAKNAGMILTDLPRTYPVLAFFHDGGPMQRPLREVLLAYAVYCPEIGYVQGMSYLVAMLLLNMDAYSAFKSFANMMHRHPHCLLFLRMDVTRMAPFYQLFDECLMDALPQLHQHFYAQGVALDMVLLEWFMTLFCKSVPLDIAARIWDLFMLHGAPVLYKAGIGILKMEQELLLGLDFDELMKTIRHHRERQWDTEDAMACIAGVEIKSARMKQIQSLVSGLSTAELL